MRSLVDPVWILLLVLTFTVFAKAESTRVNRVIKLLTRVSMSMLLFLSTGVATLIFDQILATETSPNSDWSPEFIFVLGGGYELGANNTQDFLGTESIRRVNAASALWQKYPKSRVVFSGNQPGTEEDREPTRHGELSSEHAQTLRLDKARIIIESASSNTREHPIEALKLSGVKRDSLIAIVTSDFHLRRATVEFKKHFLNVESFGTGDAASGLSWLDFVPLATHLDENAYRVKEFAGIIISKL
jgi:uncharacterized SAM-binding protein YcdF (DUF218 family)